MCRAVFLLDHESGTKSIIIIIIKTDYRWLYWFFDPDSILYYCNYTAYIILLF